MAITTEDLEVSDDDLRRRIMVTARRIAPCIDTLADGSEEKANAVAILRGVVAELPEAGARRTRSVSRNGTSMSFADIEAAFTSETRADLESLCAAAPIGMPEGAFPVDDVFDRLWPEERYS
ncbi:hypothetical protein [Microbacterium sp. 16-032]|uniref:hypothetical protein n=1 Tax=Microbacterium sp. 16-032 TaxID=3239808 RepID=UPI0034E29F97